MAAGKTTSLYLTPAAQETLEPRAGGNASGAVSRILERYAEVCKRSLPELSEAEWNLIYDACNGWLVDSGRSVLYVVMEVADHISLNQADQKWNVNGPALVAKLEALDYAGRLAVVDASERFWATPRE